MCFDTMKNSFESISPVISQTEFLDLIINKRGDFPQSRMSPPLLKAEVNENWWDKNNHRF